MFCKGDEVVRPSGRTAQTRQIPDQLSDISAIVYSSAFFLHSSSTSTTSSPPSSLFLQLTLIDNAIFICFDMAN